MTAEERAEACVAELWPGKSARAQNREIVAEHLRAAEILARSEGRREGLEEAAKFCGLYPSSLHVAAHLRLLAEDALKAQ